MIIDLFLKIADTYRDLGRFVEAAAAYRDAIDLAPERGDLWVQLGNMLKDTKRYDEAEHAYLTAIERGVDNADTHLQLGRCYRLAGRRDDAIGAFSRSWKHDPNSQQLADELTSLDETWNAEKPLPTMPSPAAIAEAETVIHMLSPVASDLEAIASSLYSASALLVAPDRSRSAWRKLYLTIYEPPQRLVLVGSIDDVPDLAQLAENSAGLLIVETDARNVSTGEALPHGMQWRSLSEFATDLSWEDRINVVVALVNGLQPAALLVWGSQVGWQLLARHGAALRCNTALFATVTAAPDMSTTQLLSDYFRLCAPSLSGLYGVDKRKLLIIMNEFGLTHEECSELLGFKDLSVADGFRSPLGVRS